MRKQIDWEMLYSVSHFETQSLWAPVLCLWMQFPLLHSCCHQPPLLSFYVSPRRWLHALQPSFHAVPSSFMWRAPEEPAAAWGPPPLCWGLSGGGGAGLWIQLKEKQADQGQEIQAEEKSKVWSSLWTFPTNHPHLPLPICLFCIPAPPRAPLFRLISLLLFKTTGFRCRMKGGRRFHGKTLRPVTNRSRTRLGGQDVGETVMRR